MTHRKIGLAFWSALAFLIWQTIAFAAECAVCERNLVGCRAPAQEKFVSCMNGQNTSCAAKCENDCKGKSESQRCVNDCARACQNAGTCRTQFASATRTCSTAYQDCKKGCTPR